MAENAARQRQDARSVIDLYREDTRSNVTVESTREWAAAFCVLYRQSHVCEQFAEDVLGVNIETWLGSHPDGRAVLLAVQETLEDPRWQDLTTGYSMTPRPIPEASRG
ncbi:hypothetical protein [Natronococcus occultus]|uniref:Uncharacterized protein n=1 Tax=Natronococcus occultus SP4 TaxID=694430 RepID=L0K2M6_9EURY|nr:hypothetical protein [Natronococcus occultus]AGB38785.1 hypothetical protein Natoc_3040 [Natronococcus occultus SP4]